MRSAAVLVVALLAASAHADEPIADAPIANEPVTNEPIAIADDSAQQADDTFGPVLVIEAIEIYGNTATRDDIIRRALPIAPGDVLHASDKRLRNARFKVLALGYFRDVAFGMKRGSQRGNVIIEIHVVERGTFVLNRLWFGRTKVAPYWFGADVGERNLLGLGIAVGGGAIYAAHGSIDNSRDQFAAELRVADGSLFGSRWGANGSVTLVHGSDIYRARGADDDDATANFLGFPYRRIGGRIGVTYDITALTRLSTAFRIESVAAELPTAPTRMLPDGRIVPVDLRLEPGESRIATGGFGVDRDTRPDPILPHSGGHLTAAIELGTAALASDYDFTTAFASYEHWWPLRGERHTIGVRLAGGVVIGNAPRFDRIYISDVDRMLTPRALGLVLSNAAPIDILTTRDDKPVYGEVGGAASVEYAVRLFRGADVRRVYGGDVFIGTGLWGLAQTADLHVRDTGVWRALPIDIYVDAGLRVDTEIGVFELTIANALGRLR